MSSIGSLGVCRPISQLRTSDHQQGKIGQTWFVWGQLEKISNPEEIQAIAKQCYQQINPNFQDKIALQSQSSFLGASAFEVWEQPSDWANEQNFKDSLHILGRQR